MKNKSILLILLFFILANCGFEPIYSSKKSNFNIGETKITNKNRFNAIIENNLRNISNNESQNIFDLIINSERKKIVSSKDAKGNPQLLTMIISVEVQIIKNNVIKNTKNFSEHRPYHVGLTNALLDLRNDLLVLKAASRRPQRGSAFGSLIDTATVFSLCRSSDRSYTSPWIFVERR